MKRVYLILLLLMITKAYAQNTNYTGRVKISFHGFICNRPTNDDPLGRDGVSDEVSMAFWAWSPITTNRANYNGITKIYGEDFFLPNRIKAGTATINGGIKAGDTYYREPVDDNNLNVLSKYDIVNTFCSNETVVAIIPALFEVDEGPLHATPYQDMGVVARRAFQDVDFQADIYNFSSAYTYNENDPYGFVRPGRYIGLDAKFAGLFTANKNKLATRPIGLFSNWNYSSQIIILTPKTIQIIAEKDFGYGKGILPVYYNEESMGNTEGHGNYIVLLKVIADIKNTIVNDPAANLRKVTVQVNNARAGDEYKFKLNSFPDSDTITMRYPDTTASFNLKIAPANRYKVDQIAGPNSCALMNPTGVVSAQDILVKANCAKPPTNQKIGIKVNAVAAEEEFEFSINAVKKIVVKEANKVVYFEGVFKTGDLYRVSQTAGPRTCQLSTVTGTVQNEDIIINAGCGEPPVKQKLKGKFYAPKGSAIVLQLNNAEKLSVTQIAGEAGESGLTDFIFNTPLTEGTNYKVAVLSSTVSGCAVIENATGQIGPDLLVNIRCDKKYDLVSRSTDNKILTTYYETTSPVIGGRDENEGRYVAFVTYGKGIDGSDGKQRQVFWRDRKLGITKLVSKNSSGEPGNNSSYAPAISADGQTVAFESYATNFGVADNNNTRDIFVWEAGTGNLSLVSKSQQGGAANGESYEPAISGNGNVIAYTSHATDIVNLGPVYSTPNVFVSGQGTNDYISKHYQTGKAASGYSPSISEDGNKIAFCSYSGHLVQGDNNNLWDIFIWQKGMPSLKRVSLTSSGAERNQGTESASRIVAPAISGDGNWVVYSTTATNMISGDNNNLQDIFMCSTSGGDVRRISQVNSTEGNGDSPIAQGDRIGISYSGIWITYNTNADNLGVLKGNIVLQNTKTGAIIPVTDTKGGSTGSPRVSREGAYIIAGCSEKYDTRFPSSGIFVFFPSK